MSLKVLPSSRWIERTDRPCREFAMSVDDKFRDFSRCSWPSTGSGAASTFFARHRFEELFAFAKLCSSATTRLLNDRRISLVTPLLLWGSTSRNPVAQSYASTGFMPNGNELKAERREASGEN
jgi:hypothetical protein